MLEHLKAAALHNDVGQRAPATAITGTARPAGSCGTRRWARCSAAPRLHVRRQSGRLRPTCDSVLWRFAAAAGVTFFGAGAAFYASCLKAGVEPRPTGDLPHLRASARPARRCPRTCYEWICSAAVDAATSGSTRSPAAPTSPAPSSPAWRRCRSSPARCSAAASARASRPGPTQGQPRGRRGRRAGLHQADAVDAALLLGRRGRPALSRQLLRHVSRASGATATGSASRRAAAPSSTAAATRRSTGTASAWARAELYRAVEALPEVLDSLVVDLEYLGRESYMPLFVVLRERRCSTTRCRDA